MKTQFVARLIFALLWGTSSSIPAHASLEQQFIAPPKQAKPLTWFHAMSGNMSKPGISKDLESIAQAGIGGIILFNVTQGIPIGDVKFNSDQHIALIAHMASECERLGLTFGVHNSDGWTSSGGPWITPKHSMKKVVWSEKIVSGGNIDVALHQPKALHNYYEDIAVIAYPALASQLDDAQRTPVIRTSNKDFDAKIASDGVTDEHTAVKPGSQNVTAGMQSTWVEFSYENPFTLRFVEMLIYEGRGLSFSLHWSNDGVNYTEHQGLPLRRPGKRVWGLDAVVTPVAAKYFRIYANKAFNIQEVKLSSTQAINNYLGRTSAARTDYDRLPTIGTPEPSMLIPAKEVVNLTESMNKKGQLRTTLPPGHWSIMRFGFTTTGAVNIPASKEGTGLEVDKFSREAFDVHYGAYISRVLEQAMRVAPTALHSLEIDSYEVGGQNWTQGYEKDFERKFGYSLIPYLPLYAGRFVDSEQTSEGVLWDTRELNGQLIVENYYSYFTELANRDGVLSYIEPYGFGPFNDIDAGTTADIPMGEFWLKRDKVKISAAASAARIYDKKIVSAEAFTAMPEFNWKFHPGMGKKDGDTAWALGVNELVFHRFAHQANIHIMPGMTMNRWGSHFDRTQPWWSTAGKDWFAYMARGQWLLRQGVSISDGLLFLGDATPTSCPEKQQLAEVIPYNINWDCLNSDVLLNQISAKNLRAVLPNGASYKFIYLTNSDRIGFDTLNKLGALAKAGVVVIGKKPRQPANWRLSKKEKVKFEQVVEEIWALPNVYQEVDWQTLYSRHNFNLDMSVEGFPEMLYTHRKTDDKDIYFLFNPTDLKQVFKASFDIAGKLPELWAPRTAKIRKLAQFPVTENQLTQIKIELEAGESVFVVFQQSSKNLPSIPIDSMVSANAEFSLNSQNKIQLEAFASGNYSVDSGTVEIQLPQNQRLTAPWQVSFNAFYGFDQTLEFDRLVDWKDHVNPEVQNYSGTAVYRQTFELPDSYKKSDQRVWLSLGKVSVAAKVSINGQEVGVSWLAPHKLDVTQHIQPGSNTLDIEVANLWVNRLIADESLPDTSGYKPTSVSNNPVTPMVQWYKDNVPPPAGERITFTTQPFYSADDERVSSGLIGPVELSVSKILHLQ